MDYQDNGRNENTSQNRANSILDAIDALIDVALSDDSEATTNEKASEVAQAKQSRVRSSNYKVRLRDKVR